MTMPRRTGVVRRGIRAIWRKLDCLKPSLQKAQSGHPPETSTSGQPDRRRPAVKPQVRGYDGVTKPYRSATVTGLSAPTPGLP